MTIKEEIHWLRFNYHEDEAQFTGVAFQVAGADQIRVWTTYRGYPESEVHSLKVLTRREARKKWRELVEMTGYHEDMCYDYAGTYSRQCGE